MNGHRNHNLKFEFPQSSSCASAGAVLMDRQQDCGISIFGGYHVMEKKTRKNGKGGVGGLDSVHHGDLGGDPAGGRVSKMGPGAGPEEAGTRGGTQNLITTSGTLLASVTKGHAVFSWTGLSRDEQLDALDVLIEFISWHKLDLFYRTGSRSGEQVLIRTGQTKADYVPDLDMGEMEG